MPQAGRNPHPRRRASADQVSDGANGALQKPELVDAKVTLHRKLIDELNLSQIERASRSELRQQVHKLVADYVLAERVPLNARELGEFVDEVMDELTGLGPIEPFLKDPTVTDILINTHERIYVERFGKLERAPVRFKDEAHVLRIVNKIVGAVGRRVDESQPMVDARLPDGSRINVGDPADRGGRAAGVDPQVRIAGLRHGGPGQGAGAEHGDGPGPRRGGQGAPLHRHFRRHRQRQDHIPECAVPQHLGQRSA